MFRRAMYVESCPVLSLRMPKCLTLDASSLDRRVDERIFRFHIPPKVGLGENRVPACPLFAVCSRSKPERLERHRPVAYLTVGLMDPTVPREA